MQRIVSRLLSCGLIVAWCITAIAQERQPQEIIPMVTRQLKPNVYWVEGGGRWPVGNSGIIVGSNGVIVVDAKSTPEGGKSLLEEVAKITSKPVTHVILTHSDGDHVIGLKSFPAGLTIIAQENNKKEQEEAIAQGGARVPPKDRLPNHVVANKESMTIQGVRFEFYHWTNAHTSGDLIVYLPEQKIAFTGDVTATNHPEPSLHPEKNGSAKGWIETGRGIAKLNIETYVPGHLTVQTKADFQERLRVAETRWNLVASMVKEGKSWEQVKTATKDEMVNGNRQSFTEIAYLELTHKRPVQEGQ